MHYHYATGIPGYGPDGADGLPTASSVLELAEALRDELSRLCDMLHDEAEALAQSGDYEDAWNTRKRSDSFEVLSANLNPEGASAPLYAGRPHTFAAELQRVVAENFPLDVTTGLRLYAWPCSEADCEHDAEEA